MTFVFYLSRYGDYLELIPLEKIYFYGKTQLQEVLIAYNKIFKHFLVLDGKIQSAEIDEFRYHEALLFPALITHPNPQKILIIGNGEGSLLNYLTKIKTIVKIDWVDFDQELVKLCRKYLPYSYKGKDNRVYYYPEDGLKFLKKTNDKL